MKIELTGDKNGMMPFKSLFLRSLDTKSLYNMLSYFSVAILDCT